MPRERLSVRKIREVLRLKWEAGQSNRAIARSCGVSHSTAREYLRRAKVAGLSWPLPETLDEDQLYRRLFPKPAPPSERVILEPDWEHIHTELRRKGVTRRLLWLEYREAHPDGYGHSRFCEVYRLWAKKLDPPMRLSHKAGEKMYVDYAGQTVRLIDPETGEIREAHIFVATLGASNYTYTEAQWTQELSNWIGGHVRAFAFFGGVPEIVVPDNTKTGVKHPSRYEPDLNPTYQDMAEHYGVVVIPARVRKPKDKAKVEVGVQVVERWILARLRNRTFFSLAELNQAIWELLEELNHRTMHHLGKSRRELFEALDRPALKPLPTEPYELAIWPKVRHLREKGQGEHRSCREARRHAGARRHRLPRRVRQALLQRPAPTHQGGSLHPGGRAHRGGLPQALPGGISPALPGPGPLHHPGRAHAGEPPLLRRVVP